MTRVRIGIDVGGTNTDAVAVDEAGNVLAWHKTPSTPSVAEGIQIALAAVIKDVDVSRVTRVMLGTTQALNALIQRRGVNKVGILRIGAPAFNAVPPLAGWPADLVEAVRGPVALVAGGHEYDGRAISPLDEEAVRVFARECDGAVKAIAITSIFSPVTSEHEVRAREIVAQELGEGFAISLGSEVAGVGLLERENAAILNGSLTGIAHEVVSSLSVAVERAGIAADLYLTQNDGTLLRALDALHRPVLTVASGATNSMRGAAYLTGLSDAIVLDVGGTSTDVGLLVDGFPRMSAHSVEIGGVQTNFRMPDLISVGLGGGSIVEPGAAVGPGSVGYRLTSDALVFGGTTLTLSDCSVAAGRASFGDFPERASAIDSELLATVIAHIDSRFEVLCDRIKASRSDVPVIVVGGGEHLVPKSIAGTSQVVRPDFADVANAVGATVADVSGSVDRNFVYSLSSRDECLDEAKRTALGAATRAGADPLKVRISSVVEIPVPYMPGDCTRVVVKASGPLAD
ncbi:MAG TPA: hydantoinase/oxoprolinase family protein [Jatrophihabitans sp.]